MNYGNGNKFMQKIAGSSWAGSRRTLLASSTATVTKIAATFKNKH